MADEITQDEEEIVTTEGEQDNAPAEEVDWRGEALKHKAIADRLKKKLSNQPIIKDKQEPKIDDDIVADVKILKEERLKRQFGFEHNLSPEETDYAFRFSNGTPTKELLEDPFFKGGLESLRAKSRLEKNIPGSSSRSSVFTEKSFTELSSDERKKTFESKMKALKK